MMKIMRKRLPSAMIYIIVFVVISILVTNASTKDNKFETRTILPRAAHLPSLSEKPMI